MSRSLVDNFFRADLSRNERDSEMKIKQAFNCPIRLTDLNRLTGFDDQYLILFYMWLVSHYLSITCSLITKQNIRQVECDPWETINTQH